MKLFGFDNGMARKLAITEDDVPEIMANQESISKAAKLHKVGITTIQSIRAGSHWMVRDTGQKVERKMPVRDANGIMIECANGHLMTPENREKDNGRCKTCRHASRRARKIATGQGVRGDANLAR